MTASVLPATPPAPTAHVLVPRLRVLVVCPSGQVGGAERWLFRLLEATQRLQITAVVMGEGPLVEEWRARGVDVTTVPVGHGRLEVARASRRIRTQIIRSAPEVVVANGVRAAAAAAPTAWLRGTPMVWAKHDHAFDGPLTRLVARTSAAVVAPSETVGSSGTGCAPVVIRPPRGSQHPWDRPRAREELTRMVSESGGTLPAEAPLALAVGARIPLKGLSDAIEAIAGTGTWHLGIIGDDDSSAPEYSRDLIATAQALGVDHRVHLVGSAPEAARLMPGAEALVQLTRPSGVGPGREGYGMTVLEAACGGVPVICTPCPAAEDLIQAGGGQGVRMVPPASPSAVAAELGGLIDPSERERAGAAAAMASRRHPATDELADQLASTLASCAGRAGAGVPVERASHPISVVAPLFSEGALAADIVQEASSQLRAGDELIAVDDASTDDTAWHIRSAADAVQGEVRLVRREHNGGVGAARNSGVRAARHDTIVFVDAGTKPATGWLDAMRAAAVSTPRPGLLAGSYQVSRRGPWQAAVASACYPSPRLTRHHGVGRRAWHSLFGLRMEADAPAGRSLGITRQAWQEIGGFDERRRAAEDVDAGRAVARAGLHCVPVADALVDWDQAPSWRGTAAMYRHYGRGDAQADHRRAVLRDVLRATAYIVAPFACLPGPVSRPRRLAVGAAMLTYVSLPMARGSTQAQPWRVVPLVPVALMLKDTAKAWGAVETLARRIR